MTHLFFQTTIFNSLKGKIFESRSTAEGEVAFNNL